MLKQNLNMLIFFGVIHEHLSLFLQHLCFDSQNVLVITLKGTVDYLEKTLQVHNLS